MTPHVRRTRALVAATLGLALSASAVAVSTPAVANDPKSRSVQAPDVFYPLVGSKQVKDAKSYTASSGFTKIAAPCGSLVRATTPGTAVVIKRTIKGATRYIVRVHTGPGQLWTGSAYLRTASVSSGQIIAAGQKLGTLGRFPSQSACALQFKVHTGSGTVNPTSWLSRHVGDRLPVRKLFNTDGFMVGSFNILGANHTEAGKRKGYAAYPTRLRRAMALLDSRGVDVVGLQEYQKEQHDYAVKAGYNKTWGTYFFDPPGPARDTDNAIKWRRSTMELVDAHTFSVPYFRGNPRAMPAVLLRERSTGRTAWFLNVHNPATSKKRGDHAGWRAKAVAVERQKVIDLRASGRPVFLLGDFNDNEKAFCPLTAGKLRISPNSVPSETCSMPAKYHSIDWIFAAGQVRFSYFLRDRYPALTKIGDHPLILGRAHLQD